MKNTKTIDVAAELYVKADRLTVGRLSDQLGVRVVRNTMYLKNQRVAEVNASIDVLKDKIRACDEALGQLFTVDMQVEVLGQKRKLMIQLRARDGELRRLTRRCVEGPMAMKLGLRVAGEYSTNFYKGE